jgi:hypothetical protein
MLIATEPIGSAGPKFTTDDKSATFERLSGSALSLTCPAQGFPLPAFRSDWLEFVICFWFWVKILNLEPIGSASPKFTTDDKASNFERLSGTTLSLTCSAQAFPLPAFRLEWNISYKGNKTFFGNLNLIEPIGSAGPKFTSDDKSDTFSRSSGTPLALKCPAQGFPVPAFRFEMLFISCLKTLSFWSMKCSASGFPSQHLGQLLSELNMLLPVNCRTHRKRKSIFTRDDKTDSFSRHSGSSIGLICPAQAYPIPAFRLDRHQHLLD